MAEAESNASPMTIRSEDTPYRAVPHLLGLGLSHSTAFIDHYGCTQGFNHSGHRSSQNFRQVSIVRGCNHPLIGTNKETRDELHGENPTVKVMTVISVDIKHLKP